MTAETSALIGFVLLAIGIAAPPDQVAGGIFLAVALAYLAMAYSEPSDRKGYWLTLVTAVAAAIAGAVLHRSLLQNWDLHFVMGAGGLFSRFLAEGMIGFGKSLREQLASLPAAIGRALRSRIGGDGD